jgi:hypothetical protein
MAKPTLLTRDAILGASDIKSEDVHVPEWGGTVRVKGLTAAERDVFETASVSGSGRNVSVNFVNIRARLVAMAIVDDSGARIFNQGDVKALGEKSASALDRVFDVARRLSGIGEQDVEELAKNSESASTDDSPSA